MDPVVDIRTNRDGDDAPSGGVAEAFVVAVEHAEQLDPLADRLLGMMAPLTDGPLRDALSGAAIGHALHPLLTDLPIGFWTSSFMLDLIGGRRGRDTSQLLIALGLASVPLTALAGWSDWATNASHDRPGGPVRRVGVAHAVLNGTATAAYFNSWIARRRGHHARGVAWGLVGATLATGAGHLGGHLVMRLGIGAGPPDAGPEPVR
jgi:uncharacterized membrane protein